MAVPGWPPAAAGAGAAPGAGASAQGCYALLGVRPDAGAQEVRNAYFAAALEHHPDLNIPGDARAAAAFLDLSQAFWVLSDPPRRELYDRTGRADLQGFSMRVVLGAWLWDFVFDAAAGLDEMIAHTLECTTPPDRLLRFADAHVAALGRIPGERFRCEICGFQIRGHAAMRAHFAERHAADAEAWSAAALRFARGSFEKFMDAAAGLGDEPFPCADGSDVRFREVGPPPDVHWSVDEDTERALAADDPCGAGAVAAALAAVPEGQREAVELLRAFAGPGLANYLAPLEDEDPDLAGVAETRRSGMGQPAARPGSAPASPTDSAPARERPDRAPDGARRSDPPGDGRWPDAWRGADAARGGFGCICGFTCGTRGALEWHLSRFPDDPTHRRALQ